MAEITPTRMGQLLQGVFEILKDQPDGLPAREVLARLERVVPPTDFEASTYPNRPGIRRYEKIVRFASINTVKAGWLLKDRGQWSVSEDGVQALEQHRDPEHFFRAARDLYRVWKAEQPPEEEGVAVEEDSLSAATTLEEAEEAAWSEIETHLADMNPYDFQKLVAGLLKAMGYHVSWVSPPGPDRGIDVIAYADPFGVSGPRIKVQVKRQEKPTTVDGLRAFMAVLTDSDVGIFVSTGGFTKDAEREARSEQVRTVTLLSAKRFFDLWIEHYDRVSEPYRRLLPLRSVHFLAPED